MHKPRHSVHATPHFRSVWISDTHLGYKDAKVEYLQHFLESVKCDRLYLLGDIVDLWSMKKRFLWPTSHYDVIKLLFAKAKSGTEIIYVPGNHDDPMREYAGHRIGPVLVQRDLIHTTAAGKRLLLIHGDELDAEIRVTRFIRHFGDPIYDLVLFINRWCNRIRNRLGLPYWSLANYLKVNIKDARRVIEKYEHAATNLARQQGLDGVICGHIHKAEVREIDGMLYCNDGDWVESCTALVEDQQGNINVIDWLEQERQNAIAAAAKKAEAKPIAA